MKWNKTTEKTYWEMLEVLPPEAMTGFGFLVGEPMNHNAQGQPCFEAFVEWPKGKFYVASEPMTIAEFKAIKPQEIGQ
jgi:hypothetical protein